MIVWGLLLASLGVAGMALAQEGPEVAEVIALTGQAEIQSAGTAFRPAQLRDRLRVGDVIRTLAQSRAKLLFQDESVTVLGEKTTLEINRFHFDRRTQERLGVLKALEGRLRFLVQRIKGAPQPTMTIESEVLSVGVRGTDGILEIGMQHRVYLLESEHPLNIQNKFTGQTLNLLPLQFVSADKQRPMQVGPITPEMLDRLTQQFRVSFSLPPKNIYDPGAPPVQMSLAGPGEGATTALPPVTQQPLPLLHFTIETGHHGNQPPQP